MAKILYLGNDKSGSTSLHRVQALRRLGHSVTIGNPYKRVSEYLNHNIIGRIHYHTGYRFLQNKMMKWLKGLKRTTCTSKFDLVWVNGGELFGPKCLNEIKEIGCPVILYNNDDPTGGRDGRRFDSLLKAISYYDLCVVRAEKENSEYYNRGAKKILGVQMSYDELAHRPFTSYEEIPNYFRSELVFIGTWMRGEERDDFILHLIKAGLPVSIWGGRWRKSPYWAQLKPYYRGGPLSGKQYVAAMQGAKICLGLLSSGNRDLHTRRSVEIPYAGGLLCAERTTEHQELYEEGKEAVFWDDAEECVQVCRKILNNEGKREEIRKAGMKRVRELEVGNEDICRKILNTIKW